MAEGGAGWGAAEYVLVWFLGSAGGWGACIMRSGGACVSQWRQRGFVRV